LVIRLALAECFCASCGVLALDEPTTNLDSDNAASLAESLRSLMEARRGQDNFQVVVITHDEAFAHMLGTREYAETLWRVTKDERGHTNVSAELIDG
jgi:DNA repair protein RAD50